MIILIFDYHDLSVGQKTSNKQIIDIHANIDEDVILLCILTFYYHSLEYKVKKNMVHLKSNVSLNIF